MTSLFDDVTDDVMDDVIDDVTGCVGNVAIVDGGDWDGY